MPVVPDGGVTDPLGVRIARPGRVAALVKARLYRPGIDRETVAEVLERYGLRTTRPSENLPLGWRNRSVLVHTASGRHVLKRYRDVWTLSAITHEHSIVRRLEEVGFPAVRLATTPEGETVVELRDRHFALFGFEEGANVAGYFVPRARRSRLQRQAGALLARFHRDLRGFAPEGGHHLGFDGLTGPRSRDLSWHLRALADLEAAAPPSPPEAREQWRWLSANAPRASSRLERLDAALTDASLSVLVIHGDFGIHNILFRGDGAAVLHDFELARLDWRLIDVAAVLSRSSVEDGRAFLAGYRAVDVVPADEWRLLPQVWEYYRLAGAVQSWRNFAEFGGVERLRTARRRIEEAARVADGGVAAWG